MTNTLYEIVFRYFRYENGGETLLDNPSFRFNELAKGEKINAKDIHTLITSLEQVGKTFLTIPVALIYLSLNYPVVYLVMDKNQKKQVHRRISNIMNKLCTYVQAIDSAINIDRFKSDSILYYDSSNKHKGDDLKMSLSGTAPRIIFIVKEHTQVERINKFVRREIPIILILDEIHKTGAYKINDSVYHDETVKYDHAIVNLKNHAAKIINISATGQDFMSVSDIYSDNIVYIKAGPYHTGIKDWIWDNSFSTKKDNKTDIMPESILTFIEKTSSEAPIVRYDRRNDKVDKHPHIILCKYHRKLDKQKEMLAWFQTNVTDFTDKWTIIVYQGEGITLYYKTIGIYPISVYNEDNIEHKSIIRDNAHYFSSVCKNSISISDCLQYLAERGTELHPKILIIGFDMCCEGISYTSHYNKPENWHLTCQISKFPSNATAALQKQVLSRVNGNHGDDIKPIICVDAKVKEKVLYSHEMTENQIFNCIQLSKIGNIKICRDHLTEMIYFKNRVPKNHYKIKSIMTNTEENPNSKKENKYMRNSEKSIDMLCMIDHEKYKETLNIIDTNDTVARYKKNQFIKTDKTATITITITKTITIPIQTIDGDYFLIESDKVRKGGLQYMIIDETIKQIISKKEIGNIILRTTINKWLLSLNNSLISDINHINGSFDSGILPKMQKVNSIDTKGLLYWKNNNRYYMKLNI